MVLVEIVSIFKIGVFSIECPPLMLLMELLGLKVIIPVPVNRVEQLPCVEFEKARDSSSVFLNKCLHKAQFVMYSRANFVMLWQAKVFLPVLILDP